VIKQFLTLLVVIKQFLTISRLEAESPQGWVQRHS